MMIELWGRVNGIQRSAGMSTHNMNPAQMAALAARLVIKPSLVQVAMSTEDQFYEALTTNSVSDGFLNRYLTVHCREKRSAGKMRRQVEPPTNLVEWVQQMRLPVSTGNLAAATLAAHDADPTPHIMDFDHEAEQMMEQFRHECVDIANSLDAIGMGEMWGRSNEISMRLAMIVARSCGSQTIRGEHLKWAQDYVRFHTEEYVKDIQEHVSDSEFAGAMQDVQRVLKNAGEKGRTNNELRQYSRKFRSLSVRLQDDILAALRREEMIFLDIKPTLSGRGKPRKAWIWTGDH